MTRLYIKLLVIGLVAIFAASISLDATAKADKSALEKAGESTVVAQVPGVTAAPAIPSQSQVPAVVTPAAPPIPQAQPTNPSMENAPSSANPQMGNTAAPAVPAGQGSGPGTEGNMSVGINTQCNVGPPGPNCPIAAMVQDTCFVYVVRGSEVIKFKKDTMELVSTTVIPAPSMAAGSGAGPLAAACNACGTPASICTNSCDVLPLKIGLDELRLQCGDAFDRAFLAASYRYLDMGQKLGQLGEDRACRPELVALGKRLKGLVARPMMTTDNILQNYGISITPEMSFDDEVCLRNLRYLCRGEDFDKAYTRAMIQYAQTGITLGQLGMQRATTRDTRDLAANIYSTATLVLNQTMQYYVCWYAQ